MSPGAWVALGFIVVHIFRFRVLPSFSALPAVLGCLKHCLGPFLLCFRSQVLLALAAVHQQNVTHRDVKPENLLVTFPGCHAEEAARRGCRPESMHLRLIDFGSAVDGHSAFHLYGRGGPSEAEQTAEYAPPEAVFGRFWGRQPVAKRLWPYDVWSLGVVWLELLLGTPHVFQVSARTRAMMDVKLHLEHKPEEERQRIYLLRGMMELCVYPPEPSSSRRHRGSSSGSLNAEQQQQQAGEAAGEEAEPAGPPVQWSCSEPALLHLLSSRDPTGRGLRSVAALRLLRSMLHWHPTERPTPAEALRHVAFASHGAGDDALLRDCGRRGRSQIGWC